MQLIDQPIADVLSRFPPNSAIQEMVFKTLDHIENEAMHDGKIMVSISGGSDSDIMLDLFERIGYPEGLVEYVWFDTGLEYDATKRHLKYLEEKYGVQIKRYRPSLTVAQATQKCGVPFLSKRDSMFIKRLQKHGFKWEDRSFEEDVGLYSNCISALKWWHSTWGPGKFSINKSSGLKEFILENHPPQISDECCEEAKKKTAKKAIKELHTTLNVIGVRRSESGIRSVRYHSCFSVATKDTPAQYRPLFYLTDEDKQEYKDFCDVTYSDCYEIWGFKRTGCVCCPFGSGYEQELEIAKKYEPKTYMVACKVFGPSYKYTREYRAFKERFKKEKRINGQVSLFDNPYDETKGEC